MALPLLEAKNISSSKKAAETVWKRGVALFTLFTSIVRMDLSCKFINEKGEQLLLVKIDDNKYVWTNENGNIIVMLSIWAG